LLSAAAVNVGTVSAFGGGTSFTITGYDNVAGADFTGYPGQWLTWRVNIKNDSAVTANYLLTLPYDVTQYFDDGSYRTIDSGFLYPASGPGGSVHVTYKDNTEYQTTGSGWGNGLVWSPFAGVGGIAAGENDNFLIKVYVPSGIVPSRLQLDFWMCDNNSGSSLKHYYIDFYVYPYASVTTRIYPMADAYVYESSADTNYGSVTNLRAYGTVSQYRTFITFPRPIAANYAITSAKVYLYCYNVAGVGTGQAETMYGSLGASWQESVITWANQPSMGAAASSNTNAPSAGNWYDWDITTYFAAQTNYVDLGLKAAAGAGMAYYYSREYEDTVFRPYLEVTYVPLGTVHYPTVNISEIWCKQENISVVYENVGKMFSSTNPSYENYATVYLQYTTDAAYIANGGSDTHGFDTAENILVGYVTSDGVITATVGNLVEGDYYWFRAKLWGQRTQAWVVSSGVRNQQLIDTIWYPPPPPPTVPATITTGSVTNLENATATLGYSLNGGTETYPIVISFFISTDNDLSTVEWDNYVTTFTPSAFQPFASGTLVLVGLTPNTTYYYRAHGYIGERGEHIYGAWAAFTTSLTIVPPGTPGPGESTTGLNITGWAASIGKGLFGGDGLPGSSGTIAGGLFLSMVIMMTILLPLAFLGMPPIGIVGILIVLVGMFTAFTWMPIWITIVIGLGFALIIAREVAGM
jgi:hypothetical protein